MHKFHPKLHELISARAEELGLKVVLNERVKVPEDGFPEDGSEFDLELLSGSCLRTDLVVRAHYPTFLFDTHPPFLCTSSVLPAMHPYLRHCAHSHQSASHRRVIFPCGPLYN